MSNTKNPSKSVVETCETSERKPLELRRERVRRMGNEVTSGIKAGCTCSDFSMARYRP